MIDWLIRWNLKNQQAFWWNNFLYIDVMQMEQTLMRMNNIAWVETITNDFLTIHKLNTSFIVKSQCYVIFGCSTCYNIQFLTYKKNNDKWFSSWYLFYRNIAIEVIETMLRSISKKLSTKTDWYILVVEI